jgi:hypothetical protein
VHHALRISQIYNYEFFTVLVRNFSPCAIGYSDLPAETVPRIYKNTVLKKFMYPFTVALVKFLVKCGNRKILKIMIFLKIFGEMRKLFVLLTNIDSKDF